MQSAKKKKEKKMVGEMWVTWILYSNHNLESDAYIQMVVLVHY